MRILISKSDALGDQILITGLVAGLRDRWPEACIVWHVRSGLESMHQLVPGGRVFLPDVSRPPASEASRMAADAAAGVCLLPFPIHPYTVRYSKELAHQLKWWRDFIGGMPWDLAINPMVSRNWLSDFTVGASRAPRRVGFAANSTCQPMIGVAAALLNGATHGPLLSREVTADPGISELENLGLLAEELIGQGASVQPRLELAPAWNEEVRRRWSLGSRPLLLFAPGVGTDQKRAWDLAHFLNLAAGVSATEFDLRWLCGPQDEIFFQHIPEDRASSVIRYTEQDLGHLAALIASARCLVCNDTSVIHLAAALGTPVVALFASAHGHRFIPTRGSVKVVQADIACRGCQWHCLFDEYACVKRIPFAAVHQAFQDVLKRSDFSPARVRMPLAPIVGHAIADEAGWVRNALQLKLARQHWDGWARLLTIQDLESRCTDSEKNARELNRQLRKVLEALRNPLLLLRLYWDRIILKKPL